MFKEGNGYKWSPIKTLDINLKTYKSYRGPILKLKHKEEVLVEFSKGNLKIFPIYNFDGCTCAPDFEKALKGCCVHDALIQLWEEYEEEFKKQGFTNEDVHSAFFEVMNEDGFWLKVLYYWAVSLYWEMKFRFPARKELTLRFRRLFQTKDE